MDFFKMISAWLLDNYIEVFGAVTGILYVFLEIRQTIWLWPVGIITSAVYIWVFFTGKLYADMSLQCYYLIISCLGWYWWTFGKRGEQHNTMDHVDPENQEENKIDEQTTIVGAGEKKELKVTRLKFRTGVILGAVFLLMFAVLSQILGRFTDSPVPGWDSFITSLSVIATWMLARKIYEHWFLWIVINSAASVLFLTRGLYPTVFLYIIYGIMSFTGLSAWRKSIKRVQNFD